MRNSLSQIATFWNDVSASAASVRSFMMWEMPCLWTVQGTRHSPQIFFLAERSKHLWGPEDVFLKVSTALKNCDKASWGVSREKTPGQERVEAEQDEKFGAKAWSEGKISALFSSRSEIG